MTYDLILFVSGASDRSGRAISDARSLCAAHLAGRHTLTVLDIHEHPDAVRAHGVSAAPTLVRARPLPMRRHVGDMSQAARVLERLELEPAPTGSAA